jgi:hypothetical protein
MQWKPIASAPFECDLELAVIDRDGPHGLVFPCRRILGSWMNVETQQRIEVKRDQKLDRSLPDITLGVL